MIRLRQLGGQSAAIGLFAVITAVQMTLIVVGNITDYATNHEFVKHVLAMDTTFQSPNVMWRAITDPGLVTAAYLAIITWEALTAVVLVAATIAWLRAFGGGSGTDAARWLSNLGWLMWIALFGGGFLALGGEWFQMWQSSEWNGSDTALRNLVIAAIGLVLAHLPQPSPARRSRVPDAVDFEQSPS